MIIVVGVSDMKVSRDEADVLITYSLGSCIGLSLYDPVSRVGGMLHCMLPLSKTDPLKARENPLTFTDTGVADLLQCLFEMGAERGRLVAKVAGASRILGEKGLLRTGERNYTVLRKVLWKNDILIAAENVGGTRARTMYLYMATGRTTVRSSGREVEF